MVFLTPAKWQALHSSVCTVHYGRAKRRWRTHMVKPDGGSTPPPLKQPHNLEGERIMCCLWWNMVAEQCYFHPAVLAFCFLCFGLCENIKLIRGSYV